MLRAVARGRLVRHACRHHRHATFCTLNSSAAPDHPYNHRQQPPDIQEATPHVRRHAESSVYSSISATELSKFSAMAETWWDNKGPFKPLHMMNPTRMSFIRSILCRHFKKDACSVRPFEGLTILDVGCGGGLLCEPLARLGAKVVGIDAVDKNIKIASAHASNNPVTASIKYISATCDELASKGYGDFDAVMSLEVIEHVTEPKAFLESLSGVLKADGAMILSTINRSVNGYLLAIVAAEHLLNWVPKGTHEWTKFITPDELALLMDQAGVKLQELAGMVFNPLTAKWSLSMDTSVNYIAYGTKPSIMTSGGL